MLYLGSKLLIKGMYFVGCLYNALYNRALIFFVGYRKITCHLDEKILGILIFFFLYIPIPFRYFMVFFLSAIELVTAVAGKWEKQGDIITSPSIKDNPVSNRAKLSLEITPKLIIKMREIGTSPYLGC